MPPTTPPIIEASSFPLPSEDTADSVLAVDEVVDAIAIVFEKIVVSVVAVLL